MSKQSYMPCLALPRAGDAPIVAVMPPLEQQPSPWLDTPVLSSYPPDTGPLAAHQEDTASCRVNLPGAWLSRLQVGMRAVQLAAGCCSQLQAGKRSASTHTTASREAQRQHAHTCKQGSAAPARTTASKGSTAPARTQLPAGKRSASTHTTATREAQRQHAHAAHTMQWRHTGIKTRCAEAGLHGHHLA